MSTLTFDQMYEAFGGDDLTLDQYHAGTYLPADNLDQFFGVYPNTSPDFTPMLVVSLVLMVILFRKKKA
jgi:hypothetical protein